MSAWSKLNITVVIFLLLALIAIANYLFLLDSLLNPEDTNISVNCTKANDCHNDVISIANYSFLSDSFLYPDVTNISVNSTKANDHHNDDAIVRINGEEKCRFQTGKNESLPVILISMGRSGSSVTWMTLSKLIGAETVAYEHTGSNPPTTREFFESIPASVGPLWASLQSCIVQNRDYNRVPSISGFQWKPFFPFFRYRVAVEALKEIALRRNPRIRVIFLMRNPLDRKISNIKHQIRGEAEKVPAHCAVDDEKCREEHLKTATDLVLYTGKELLQFVREAMDQLRIVEDTLVASKVDYVKIEYEKLYNSDDANEWMRVFQFLGRGPAKGLTMDDIRNQFPYARTDKPRSETVKNWAEVVKTLNGTEFQWMAEI